MRVLSIEIGPDLTHVIEMDYKTKNPKTYVHFDFQTPEGVLDDAGVHENDRFKKTLQKFIKSRKIKTKKVLFVITSGKIASREVEIPLVRNNQIRRLLETNSAEYFPVDLTHYQLVYRTISDSQVEKEKRKKLFVIAVPNELVHSYEMMAAYCGLELAGLDYVGNSVFQIMHKAAKNNVAFGVKIEKDSTLITIISKGEVQVQRTILYGVGEAEALIAESGLFAGKGYKNAKDVLENELCVYPRLDREKHSEMTDMELLRYEVTEALRPMVENINRIMDYYVSRNTGDPLKECMISGSGVHIKGLTQLMSTELELPVMEVTRERSGINGITREMSAPEYLACYGAAIAPLSFNVQVTQIAADGKVKVKSGSLIPPIIFIGCVLTSIAIAIPPALTNIEKQAEIAELTAKQRNLAYIRTVYNEYLNTQARYADVTAMNAYTKTVSDALADAIDEMEQKLPSNVTVKNMTSDGLALIMELTVTNKTEVAQVLSILRGFELFRDVSTSSVLERADESGKVSVDFTVMCTYVDGKDLGTVDDSIGSIAAQDVNTYVNGEQYVTPDFGTDSGEEATDNE